MTSAKIELVVIGASSGGIEAISELLAALPARITAALAVVLHMPPEKQSILAEIFGRRCQFAVREVEDKEPVLVNTVYIAAPDHHMMVEPQYCFSLSRDEAVNYSRPSIDLLLESAAMAYRERVLAIVLTGANADGAEGAREIRQQGGLVWVQDPGDARSDAMPLAAIKAAGADYIAPVAQLAQKLALLIGAPGGNAETAAAKAEKKPAHKSADQPANQAGTSTATNLAGNSAPPANRPSGSSSNN